MALKAFLSLALALLPSAVLSANSLPFDITSDTPGVKGWQAPSFPIQGFTKYSGNPILSPDKDNDLESAYIYNPSAIVLKDTIFLLYRAQNAAKTSSVGLAWSTDGTTFERLDYPILNATETYEAGGGTEDPRIIRVDGTFYLTYTGWDKKVARLCIATSTDLLHWKKYGPLFPDSPHSKSGAITNEKAADGLYHMYLNDTDMYHATSPNLIDWTLAEPNPFAKPVDTWDRTLVEPGPAPIKTRDGKWLLIYNGRSGGDGSPPNAYSTGQMLIDPANYTGPLDRLDEPFLIPSTEEETQGQVPNVIFSEGLVQFKGKWYLYFGQSDETLGVAIANVGYS